MSCIVTVNIRRAKSKLRGNTHALCILAKFTSKFEFVFTSLVKNSPRMFATVQAVQRFIFDLYDFHVMIVNILELMILQNYIVI